MTELYPRWLRYKWLDLESLATKIIPLNSDLEQVNYFTSMIKNDSIKAARQKNYIDALEAHSNNLVVTRYGTFQDYDIVCKNKHCQAKPLRCQACGYEYRKPNEKKTDVNLSTCMLTDCFENKTDCVVLISGDKDYEMPLTAIRKLFPAVRVILAFPPKRKSAFLSQFSSEPIVNIDEMLLMKSLLPDPVSSPFSSTKYSCPVSWR